MSVIGLALGVAVLIVVLSVLNGFETRAAQPHAGRDLARHHHRARRRASPTGAARRRSSRRRAGRAAPSRRTSRRAACWPTASAVAGAMVRGVLPEEEGTAIGLGSRMLAGALDRSRGRQVPHRSSAARSPQSSASSSGRRVVLMTPEGTRHARRLRAAHEHASPSAASSNPACTSSIAASRSCTWPMPRSSTASATASPACGSRSTIPSSRRMLVRTVARAID